MQFPTPQHFLQQASASALTHDASHRNDPYQWETFDELFDRVFDSSQQPLSRPGSPPDAGVVDRKSGVVPGAYSVGTLSRSNSSAGDSGSDSGENFDQAWDDALRRAKKTITTTTKRRIIRHTPAAPKLEMPAPAFAPRIRFPKTPYPRSDSSEESSDPDEDDAAAFSTPEPIPRPKSTDNTLPVPSSGLTPELHSPVKYVPDWKQESRLTWREPVEMGWATATFDMPTGLSKNDIHVAFSNSFGGEKVTVSWQHTEIVEVVMAGKLVRERRERKYHRTLPLPKGISFRDVQANLTPGLLTITYPRNPQTVLHHPRPIDVLQLTR